MKLDKISSLRGIETVPTDAYELYSRVGELDKISSLRGIETPHIKLHINTNILIKLDKISSLRGIETYKGNYYNDIHLVR